MTRIYRFDGEDPVRDKHRVLVENIQTAIEGMPRTLLIGATMTDPKSPPGADNNMPRGIRLFLMDEQMSWLETACLVGAIQAISEHLLASHTEQYGEHFERASTTAGETFARAFKLNVMGSPDHGSLKDTRNLELGDISGKE